MHGAWWNQSNGHIYAVDIIKFRTRFTRTNLAVPHFFNWLFFVCWIQIPLNENCDGFTEMMNVMSFLSIRFEFFSKHKLNSFIFDLKMVILNFMGNHKLCGTILHLYYTKTQTIMMDASSSPLKWKIHVFDSYIGSHLNFGWWCKKTFQHYVNTRPSQVMLSKLKLVICCQWMKIVWKLRKLKMRKNAQLCMITCIRLINE